MFNNTIPLSCKDFSNGPKEQPEEFGNGLENEILNNLMNGCSCSSCKELASCLEKFIVIIDQEDKESARIEVKYLENRKVKRLRHKLRDLFAVLSLESFAHLWKYTRLEPSPDERTRYQKHCTNTIFMSYIDFAFLFAPL